MKKLENEICTIAKDANEDQELRLACEELYKLLGEAIIHSREKSDDAFACYLIVKRHQIAEKNM